MECNPSSTVKMEERLALNVAGVEMTATTLPHPLVRLSVLLLVSVDVHWTETA